MFKGVSLLNLHTKYLPMSPISFDGGIIASFDNARGKINTIVLAQLGSKNVTGNRYSSKPKAIKLAYFSYPIGYPTVDELRGRQEARLLPHIRMGSAFPRTSFPRLHVRVRDRA